MLGCARGSTSLVRVGTRRPHLGLRDRPRCASLANRVSAGAVGSTRDRQSSHSADRTRHERGSARARTQTRHRLGARLLALGRRQLRMATRALGTGELRWLGRTGRRRAAVSAVSAGSGQLGQPPEGTSLRPLRLKNVASLMPIRASRKSVAARRTPMPYVTLRRKLIDDASSK